MIKYNIPNKLGLLSILFLLINCSGYKNMDKYDPLEVDPSTPPGTIQLTDNLYIDKVPVTNLMYNEFLDHLENYWSLKRHEELKNLPSYGVKPDSVFIPWSGNTRLYMAMSHENPFELINNKLNVDNYTSAPWYQWHPVVQINKEQAEMYCKWRTDVVNAVYAIRSKNARKRDRFPSKVTYRLPTVAEMKAAQYKLDREYKLLRYKEQIYGYNGDFHEFKRMQDDDQLFIFELNEYAQTGEYNPLFDYEPNVYQKSEFQNGFRCICEVE